MEKLDARKKAELKLIVELMLDATLAAEEKITRLSERAKAAIPSG